MTAVSAQEKAAVASIGGKPLVRKPKAPNGGAVIEASLGDADVWIEYEYSPGDTGRTSGPPERCYPPEPEELYVHSVLVNDEWLAADDDTFALKQIERWEQAARDHLEFLRECDKADRADARYEWEMT